MKLVKQHYEILEQEPGIQGIYKAIERAGRLSYRSEDKITEDSAEPFVVKLINARHMSCLEHGTVYLKVPYSEAYSNLSTDNNWVEDNYYWNPYSVVIGDGENYYITSNYRVLIEHGWLDDLKYLCEPTEYHERRISVFFNSDIGTMRELFRHRKMSYIQESTRFCNYSKGKFNGEVTFIQPPWLPDSKDINNHTYGDLLFISALKEAEKKYLQLIAVGYKPEQARNVLPLATKSEAIVTGFVSDWGYIFRLRTSIAETGRPHPQMLELMDPLYEEFINRNLISKIK